MKTEHAKRIYLEQIRRVVSLQMILARYNIELRKQGQQLYGRCPICASGGRRAFVVNPSTSEWKCFAPAHNTGGAMLEFTAAMEHVEILEAARLVARWFAIGARDQPHSQQKERRKPMSEGRSPDFKAYSSQKREGQKDYLTRIGSAWKFTTKDNRPGVSIQLSALPIGDRIVLFEYDDEQAEEPEDRNAKRKK